MRLLILTICFSPLFLSFFLHFPFKQCICPDLLRLFSQFCPSSRYRRENARRRHNYLPFIIEILRILAKEGRLVPMVEKVCVITMYYFIITIPVKQHIFLFLLPWISEQFLFTSFIRGFLNLGSDECPTTTESWKQTASAAELGLLHKCTRFSAFFPQQELT